LRKPNADLQEWRDQRDQRQHQHELRTARVARHRASLGRTGRAARRLTVVVPFPVKISADRDEDRGRLLQALGTLMEALRGRTARVKLDFSRTVRMFPGGMLLLLAYLELLLEQYPGQMRASCTPGSLIAQLFHHFKLGGRLGVSPARNQPRADSVVGWRYLTGTIADGESIAKLLDGYRQLTSANIPDGLYDVLSEALTNVRHHAYPDGGLPETLRRWWLFARYVEPAGEEPGNLFIGVYDLGVGIQASLHDKLTAGERAMEFVKWLTEKFGADARPSRALDRALLETAIEATRSRTGLSFRGNGLPEMRDFVLSTESGRLLIISGQSQYLCTARSQQSTTTSCQEPILGTLIVWSIPLLPKGLAA
jgi:hypothetical protein